MSAIQPGDRIGSYRLERLIDDTGRSQVWLARDERLDRNVALKVRWLATSTEAEAERIRFERSSRIAARVEHPGLISVYASGATASTSYLAMQYVPGRNLAAWLVANPRASIDSRFHILAQVADALDHAHGLGIAHGSISLANIIVDESVQPQRGVLAQLGRSDEVDAHSTQPIATIEADRSAFWQLLKTVFAPTSTGSTQPRPANESCVELLRFVLAKEGADPRPTPPTVVRTRRSKTKSRRIAAITTAVIAVVVVSVGALELLQDGMTTFSDKNPPLSTQNTAASNSVTQPGKQTVLILGDQFESNKGSWTKRNRRSVYRMKKGVDAADVVETSLLTVPSTADYDTKRIQLRGGPGRCRDALQNSLDHGTFSAIVVLESPCTLTVARLLAARENKLPPVYWLDDGRLADDIWGNFMVTAPTADLGVAQYPDATSGLLTAVGPHTGENFARVLPFGTYRDVGKFVEQEQLATGPCFYLATRDFERGVVVKEYETFENFRIASGVAEVARGFGVATSQISVGEVVPPLDSDSNFFLPTNGSITGSISDDQKLIDKVRESSAKCVLIETYSGNSLWALRLVNRLVKDLPDITLVNYADPSDAYAPGVDVPPSELEAFNKLMRHPRLFSLSQAPYVSRDAPLAAHFDSVTEALYEPLKSVDYDRPNWWRADDYALVLVAELIGTQPADRGDGRPGFGRLEKTLWATAEADFLYSTAPVQLDPVERIYSGYLVHVHHKGELYDAFYGGLTESP